MTRKTLSDPDKFALWANSGGICAIRGCEEELIFTINGINVNTSNAAHIISHGGKGPRSEYKSEYGITEFNVDDVPNLMLTCLKHHKIIDAEGSKDRFPPKLLYEMKEEHEAWVKSQLSKKQKSIAFLHKTKGGPIDEIVISRELQNSLVASIQYQEEFTDFSQESWQQGKRNNEELMKSYRSTTRQHTGTRVEMFPLSHIPLLIHIGFLLTDTTPLTVYQYDRNNQNWVLSSPQGIQSGVKPEIEIITNGSKSLVVTIGLSGSVELNEVEDVIPDKDFDLFSIKIDDPRPDRVLYSDDVEVIKQLFYETVLTVHTSNKYKDLHLFYAGPAGLAVELGRCINESMWPYVHLYNYEGRNEPKYQFAFKI
jgi:hypothetical protein